MGIITDDEPTDVRIEEREKPTPRPDEVLIEVKAIGLNHLDTGFAAVFLATPSPCP